MILVGGKIRIKSWFLEVWLIELLQELFAMKGKCNIIKQCWSLFNVAGSLPLKSLILLATSTLSYRGK